MKNLLLTLILSFWILSCNAQSQREKEEIIRSEINTEFEKNMTECYAGVDAVSDFNGKTEFWNICELKNGNRIITIDSHKEDTYYQEIYFEKNGDLITLMSLGHGKTEDEEWNPDVIFEMYKNRITELKRINK